MDKELSEALEELRLARNQYEFADEDHIEIACLAITLAEKKVSAVLERRRRERREAIA